MPFWQFRTIKELYSAPGKPWANIWEAFTPATDVPALGVIANAVMFAERQIHLDYVRFLGWSANLYVTQSDKFDPNFAPDVTVDAPGLRVSTGQQMYDIEMCYQWKLKTNSRAFGKKGFRACLLEVDVETGSNGRSKLVTGSGLYPGGTDWANFLDNLESVYNVAPGTAGLVCYTRFQTSPRGTLPKTYGPWAGYDVTSFQQTKLGNIAMEHAWYNRN